MRQKYEEEVSQSLKEQQEPKTKLPTTRRGTPLMLGKIDLMVKKLHTGMFYVGRWFTIFV